MIISGALRGLGKQTIVTWIVLFSFYVLVLPLAYYFAFMKNLGIFGLWLGPICGCSVELLISIVIIFFYIDWEKLSEEILEKVKLDKPTRTLSTSYSEPLLDKEVYQENGTMV